ncbi:Gamma-tubulin complex component 4 [Chytriomyces hyalinus]|nr:Gamma-tubulin complex component 4 [Chytriomyces hyalinus]
MKHQILALLAGHGKGGTDDLLGDIPQSLLHGGERESVARLATVGDERRVVGELVAGINGGDDMGSIARAVAHRVSKNLLAPYSQTISKLETDSLQGHKNIPLAVYSDAVQPFAALFPSLRVLLQRIRSKALHGTAINAHLYSLVHSTGAPNLRILWSHLLHAANAVLARFLIVWMVHGRLLDSHNEFFIASIKATAANTSKGRWSSEYALVPEMIPQFVPASVATDILFVGKAVSAIRESPSRKDSIIDVLIESSTAELAFLAPNADQNVPSDFKPLEFHIAVKKIKKLVARVLWDVVVVEENLLLHLEACRNYFLMGRGDFYVSFIEESDKMTIQAAARLSSVTEQDLTLLVKRVSHLVGAQTAGSFADGKDKDDDLLKHLRFKKVAVGEANIHESQYAGAFLGIPIRLEYAVKWPLDLVFTEKDMEKYNEIFTFLVFLKRTQMRLQRLWSSTKSLGVQRMESNSNLEYVWAVRHRMMFFVDSVWSYIQMDVLAAEYHKLLQIITQPSKNESKRGDTAVSPDPSLEAAVDSISLSSNDPQPAAQHPNASSASTSGADFEDILTAHSEYLDACLAGCFMNGSMKKFVGGTLRTALGACDAFVGIVERGCGMGHDVSEGLGLPSVTEDLKRVGEDFQQQSAFLFRVFSGVKETTSRRSSHLDALLLRLDHNSYYSSQ